MMRDGTKLDMTYYLTLSHIVRGLYKIYFSLNIWLWCFKDRKIFIYKKNIYYKSRFLLFSEGKFLWWEFGGVLLTATGFFLKDLCRESLNLCAKVRQGLLYNPWHVLKSQNNVFGSPDPTQKMTDILQVFRAFMFF